MSEQTGQRPVNEAIFIPIADTTVESIPLAIGISAERENELDNLIEKAHDETENYADCISYLSNECADAKELAYCVFYLGVFVENARQKNKKLEALSQLLGGL